MTFALMVGILTQRQAVRALLCSENQDMSPLGVAEALEAAQTRLQGEGEWDLLSTKALLVVRDAMLDEAAVLANRDCYLAIAFSSLCSLVLTLFLRLPQRRR